MFIYFVCLHCFGFVATVVCIAGYFCFVCTFHLEAYKSSFLCVCWFSSFSRSVHTHSVRRAWLNLFLFRYFFFFLIFIPPVLAALSQPKRKYYGTRKEKKTIKFFGTEISKCVGEIQTNNRRPFFVSFGGVLPSRISELCVGILGPFHNVRLLCARLYFLLASSCSECVSYDMKYDSTS